jgi:transcriptional regulator with XRE-family HTH domain
VASSSTVSTLERLRLERGLSRLDVERAVPINRKTLWQLEICETPNPRAATIYRLAVFYNVRPEWLLAQYRHDRHERSFRDAA